ncbi:MAG: response regulator transcription factor [Lachnospiraceae bacterium]|nr:response regulator transcription factor [Lachnospiraceae bacterium]
MKLLLAEDTQDLNRAITAILRHEGYEVDNVFDGIEAMEYIANSGYDGIILDIMMPGKDGLEVLRETRSRHILTPVLLLTAKTEIDDRVSGLDAGADDYLPKPFAMKELLARVRSMTRRHSAYNTETRHFCDITLNPEDYSMTANNSIRLSAKEYELMELLIANPDIPLSTEVLLDRLWKSEPDAQEDTVWLYVSYLRGKLLSIGSSLTISGSRGGSFQLSL